MSSLKNQLFRASLIKHITDSRSSCQKNCFMVLLLGLKMWWYFCLKSANAWHSKMTWYSSPMQFSWHLLQKRRERGTPKRRPESTGKPWQPVLNLRKPLIKAARTGTSSKFLTDQGGLANQLWYVAYWEEHALGQSSSPKNSCLSFIARHTSKSDRSTGCKVPPDSENI